MSDEPLSAMAERFDKWFAEFVGDGCELTFRNRNRHHEILWDLFTSLTSNGTERPATRPFRSPNQGDYQLTERGDGLLVNTVSIGNYQSDDISSSYVLLVGDEVCVETNDENDPNLGPPSQTRFTVRARSPALLERVVTALLECPDIQTSFYSKRTELFGNRVPKSLQPFLDELLSSGDCWLPLGSAYSGEDRFLRAAHQLWFDIIVMRDGQPILKNVDDVATLHENTPQLFAAVLRRSWPIQTSAAQQNQLAMLGQVKMPQNVLERAKHVDEQFQTFWPGLEQGTQELLYDDDGEEKITFRRADGRYCVVSQHGGAVSKVSVIEPLPIAFILRSRLWKGAMVYASTLSQSLSEAVERANAVDTILKAKKVELVVESSSGISRYLLNENEAFCYEDTGREEPAPDGVPVCPSPIYDFVLCKRADVEKALRSPFLTIHMVEYQN